MSSTLAIISWRDIPAQIIAKTGREAVKQELPPQFQVAIDRAAMEAGLFDTDGYLSEWRRTSRPCGENLAAEVETEVTAILARYPSEVLNRIAGNQGLSPDGAADG